MKDNVVSTIARIVYALVMGFFALNHFMHPESMAGAVPSFLPSPVIWVYIVGGALVLATLAILIGIKVKLAGYLLGLMLLIILLSVHVPNLINATDDAGKMMPMTMILKDLGLAAAAFYIGSKHK